MWDVRVACKYISLNIFIEGHNGFLHDVSVTLIDKTDGKNLIKQEHYWHLKNLAPHGRWFLNYNLTAFIVTDTIYWSIICYYCIFNCGCFIAVVIAPY